MKAKLSQIKFEIADLALANQTLSSNAYINNPRLSLAFLSSPLVCSGDSTTLFLKIDMASVLRLAMRRQSGQHSAACRVLTRPLSSKTVTSLKLSSLKVQQFHPNPSPPRTAIQKSTPTRILQIASFHTSGRREILPAGPRNYHLS